MVLRYDFIRLSALKERSLTAFVAGMTKTNLVRVHTSERNSFSAEESSQAS